ncbi:MAG: hypothetical protein LUC18_02155 [Porphyromonadaceae bacterium]|nr:hypothetical protein [Porphyromonadaceae bacterium]
MADEGGEYTAPENALCDNPADIYEAIKSLPLPLEKSFMRYAMIRVVLARVFDYFMHADTLLDYVFSKE